MSKIDYQDLSAKIMDNIGGVKNVKTVTHCVTRLRFYLHDRNIAEDSEIKKLPGVLGVVLGMDNIRLYWESIYLMFTIIS